MIVDDEVDLPRTIKDYLEDETDFEVTMALSGEEAVERLKEFRPDLCIVDVRLSGLTGNDFILLAHEKMPACRFIIHTGSVDYVLPPELEAIGLSKDSLLFKPVQKLSEFKIKITTLLNI